MLDTLYASFNGSANCLRGIGVDSYIGAPIVGIGYGRSHLFVREFGHIDRVIVRTDTTTEGKLDLARTLHQLFSHQPVNCIHSICNGGIAETLSVGNDGIGGGVEVGKVAEVAMTGCLRYHDP